MKRKVYLTLKDQQENESNYLSRHNLTECDVVTVDQETKLKLDRIRNRMIGLWFESRLSKNHKENVAERLIRLVTFAMGAARQIEPDCPPIKAVSILRGQSGFFGMGAFNLEECFGAFANAVTEGDSELFLALAKLLKSPPVKHGLDALVIHAHQAYDELQQGGIPFGQFQRLFTIRSPGAPFPLLSGTVCKAGGPIFRVIALPEGCHMRILLRISAHVQRCLT